MDAITAAVRGAKDEALRDLLERVVGTVDRLNSLTSGYADEAQVARIEGKVEGVRLVQSYIEEALREGQPQRTPEPEQRPQQPPKVRSANAVSRALNRHDIPTGYRHTDFGYVDRNGAKITRPGVQVTRNKVARYGGFEDYGYVAVFCIGTDPRGIVDPEFVNKVEQTLQILSLPYRRKGDDFEVLDPS